MIGKGPVLPKVTEMAFGLALSSLSFEVVPGKHFAHIEGLALASAYTGIYPSIV